MILKNKVSLRISNVSARLLRCVGLVKLLQRGGLNRFTETILPVICAQLKSQARPVRSPYDPLN